MWYFNYTYGFDSCSKCVTVTLKDASRSHVVVLSKIQKSYMQK